MKNKKQHYIPTEEFIKKFPKKIEDLMIYYNLSKPPKISQRRFRDYYRKNFMPKPRLIGRKSYYSDSLGMYRWLFMIWYLIHYRRTSAEEILKILDYFRKKGISEAILLLLDKDELLYEVLTTGDLKTTLIETLKEDYSVWKEIEYVHKVMKYILNRDLTSFRENLELFIENPKLLKEEKNYVQNRFKDYKEIAEDIEKALEEVRQLKLKVRI